MTLFPHTASEIYLNHAAISPYSTAVKYAIDAFITQRHKKKIDNYFDFQNVITETYQRLGLLLHTDSSRICFTPNTSSGLNILANGYPWQKGDRILLNRQEFPTNVYPFLNCQRFGVEIDFVGNQEGPLSLSDLEKALTPRTRLISISMVQFLSGQAVDLNKLGEICHHNQSLLCVDAIQGLGASDLNVEKLGIDFLACGSHKWLMAPEGLGFVYVSNKLQATLTPSAVGWLSVKDPWELLSYDLNFTDDARRYQTGTMNHIAIAGLHAALGQLMVESYSSIRNKVFANAQFFLDSLPQLNWLTPPNQHLGIVSFRHPEAITIYQQLLEMNTTVSVRENQFIRISPHYYHHPDELSRAVKQLKQILSSLNN